LNNGWVGSGRPLETPPTSALFKNKLSLSSQTRNKGVNEGCGKGEDGQRTPWTTALFHYKKVLKSFEQIIINIYFINLLYKVDLNVISHI